MITLQEVFRYGLDREVPALIDPPEGPQINLGAGDKKFVGYLPPERGHNWFGAGPAATTGVGPTDELLTDVAWLAPDPIPFKDESVAAVHAYQFMEHLDCDTAIEVLREVERVLMPRGVMFVATPYPGHAHYYQALDHKTAWTEETWEWLFANDYYKPAGEDWRLSVNVCVLMGVVERNLNLITQLYKEEL